MMQYVTGFRHFDHKSRLSFCQIIAGTDACQNAINRPDFCCACRHIAADMRQQNNKRILPHIGRFTAHIRPGDNQHAAVFIKLQIIGLERFAAYRFHHRMPAALDMNTGSIA